jgi:hypothetical protein
MNAPSTPGHHNDCVLVGTVDLVHVTQGHLTAILLRVSTGGDALKIIVCPRAPAPAVERGDVLWVRGRLAYDPAPDRKALHYLDAQHLDVIKKGRNGHGA